MDAWADSLQETLAEVWRRLSRGAADRRAPARHPVLATAGRDGGAEARILVLRGADRDGARIELHTDRLSGKAAELAADPRAALLVWDAEARLQIRLRLRAAMRTGADAAQAWARVPESARLQYGGMPPGTPIAAPGEDRPAAEAALRGARLPGGRDRDARPRRGPPPACAVPPRRGLGGAVARALRLRASPCRRSRAASAR